MKRKITRKVLFPGNYSIVLDLWTARHEETLSWIFLNWLLLFHNYSSLFLSLLSFARSLEGLDFWPLKLHFFPDLALLARVARSSLHKPHQQLHFSCRACSRTNKRREGIPLTARQTLGTHYVFPLILRGGTVPAHSHRGCNFFRLTYAGRGQGKEIERNKKFAMKRRGDPYLGHPLDDLLQKV